MRQWPLDAAGTPSQALAGAIAGLGEARFAQGLLDGLHPLLPAASFSVYRTGPHCEPALFLSASHGIPDTTRDCWKAYLSGPYLSDRTLYTEAEADAPAAGRLSHITAREVPPEHRAKVYEAYGMAERVSVVQAEPAGGLFAVNFYRHGHQRPFSDAQIGDFGQVAALLLALAHRHLALRQAVAGAARTPAAAPRGQGRPSSGELVLRLQALQPRLTPRECEVCARLLQGMTFDGIASELGLSLPTVKTYRNRAFARLGIHFRNELFALAQ